MNQSTPKSELILIRSLPGSGKTSLTEKLMIDPDSYQGSFWTSEMFSADDHFTKQGVYNFDPRELPVAHSKCQENVKKVF